MGAAFELIGKGYTRATWRHYCYIRLSYCITLDLLPNGSGLIIPGCADLDACALSRFPNLITQIMHLQ
jgi:hypothetical protein